MAGERQVLRLRFRARYPNELLKSIATDNRQNAPTRAGEAVTYPGLLRGFLLAQAGRSVSSRVARHPAPDSPAGGARGGRIGSFRSAQEARYVLGAVSTVFVRLKGAIARAGVVRVRRIGFHTRNGRRER
jgi:hypothetical protein